MSSLGSSDVTLTSSHVPSLSSSDILALLPHHIHHSTFNAPYDSTPVKCFLPSTLSPWMAKKAAIDPAQSVLAHDVKLLSQLEWHELINHCHPMGDFFITLQFYHPAHHLLHFFKHHGASVKLSMPPWTCHHIQHALCRGPHKSCHDHLLFLHEEFINIINRGQLIFLLYSAIPDIPGLGVSPPGIIPQSKCRLC